MTTWFITGASSGLGAALARAVLERGHNAVITARNVDHVRDVVDAYPSSALAVRLDVTDHDQMAAAVRAATKRFGAVDVLVNNARHGYRAAVEEGAVDEVDDLFATNFFGPVDLIKQVLPQMRQRRSGTIVNVSSIGAPDPTEPPATTPRQRQRWRACPTPFIVRSLRLASGWWCSSLALSGPTSPADR